MIQLIVFIIFIYSIILHEISHGFVAEHLGDPTARLSGRLTLKLSSHIDPIMSILVPFFFILSGSPVIFGSAKPVPIDPFNLRNPRKDMGLIALAGPTTNILIAIILSLIARLLLLFLPSATIVFSILKSVVQINLFLAVFNLTPIPPLDGGRVAVALLPSKYAKALASLESIGIPLILFFYLFPTRLLPLPQITSTITNFLFRLIFPNLPLV